MTDAKSFLESWISLNIFPDPFVTESYHLDAAVDRLRLQLVRDAAQAGVTLAELEPEVGDLREYLTKRWREAQPFGNRV